MKIALVSPYDFAYPGGVNEHISYLEREFRRRGHQVRILAPSSLPVDELPKSNIYRVGKTIMRIPANASIARISLSLTLSREVKEILDTERFQIVHLHEPLAPTLPITVLRHSHAVNIGTFHAYRKSHFAYLYGKPLLKRYVNRLHGRIAVSEAARSFIERYFPGDYRVIPNGIDLELYRGDLPPFSELRDGKRNILFVGRLEKRKGLIYLLKALRLVQQHLPEPVRLIVVGAFTEEQRLEHEAAVRELNLRDVLFQGFVSTEAKVRYYKTCDIFCAPSTGGESQGIVLLEAMAAGKPVIASDIEGYRAVLQNTQAGVLVPPQDEHALARILLRLLENETLCRQMGERGQAAACNYAWEKIATRILEFYEQTLASMASPGKRDWQVIDAQGKTRRFWVLSRLKLPRARPPSPPVQTTLVLPG
jgi:phosphatidylinositol alpha-mannosyltransferase